MPVDTAEDKRGRPLPPWPLRRRALLEIAAAYAALVIVGLALGWILLDPLAGSGLAATDESLALQLQGLRTEQWNELTDLGSAFSDTTTIIVALVVLISSLVFFLRRWREALTLGLALLLESSVFLTVSLTVGRDRPPVSNSMFPLRPRRFPAATPAPPSPSISPSP